MTSVLLLALSALAGQQAPPLHVVAIRADGTAAVAHVTGEESTQDRAEPVDHWWVWTSAIPPSRVAGDAAPRCEQAKSQHLVTVTLRFLDRREEHPPGQVLAAPAEMWSEVPEDLLPSWEVNQKPTLEVPVDGAKPWRVRYISEKLGSTWVDVQPQQRGVQITVAPAETMALIVSGSSGQAVKDARLSLLRGPDVIAVSQTGAAGLGSFASVPVEGSQTVLVEEPSSVPHVVKIMPLGAPTAVRLEAGVRLTGMLLDPVKKSPLVGGTVRAEAWLSPDLATPLARVVKSDESGRWQLFGLPAGRILVIASHEGRIPFRKEIDAEPGALDLGAIPLGKGVQLAVAVSNDAGEPVEGARIASGHDAVGTTDHRGLVRLDGLPQQRQLDITATAPGHEPASVVVPSPYPAQLRIRLVRSFTVRGRLLTSDGQPVSGGKASLARSQTSSRELADIASDGAFAVELPPGAAQTLELSSPETRNTEVEVAAGQPGEARDLGDVVAPKGIIVTGRTVADDDGTPVPDAQIWSPRTRQEGGGLYAAIAHDLLRTKSQEDGSFRLTGLDAAPSVLRIDAAGYARLRVPVEPSSDSPVVDVGDLALYRGCTVSVEVGGESHDVLVSLDPADSETPLDTTTVSALGGSAVFRHVPAGQLRVTAKTPSEPVPEVLCEQVITVPEGEQELTVRCDDDRISLSGTVLEDGSPKGPGMLAWRREANGPSAILSYSTSAGLSRQVLVGAFPQGGPPVPVASDGTFFTKALRPGTWQARWFPDGQPPRESIEVVLPAVPSYDAVLNFSGTALHGVVRDGDGGAVAGAQVQDLNSGAVAMSQPDGSFVLGGLHPPALRVQARFRDLSSDVLDVVLTAGQEPEPVELVLDDGRDTEVEVMVSSRYGEPVSGAFVFVEDPAHRRGALTDGSGIAVVRLGKPLPNSFRAAAFSQGSWLFGDWVSWERPHQRVTLVGERTGSLEVSSRDATEPVAILTPTGWRLDVLRQQIGGSTVVTPDVPLVLTGLPAGRYQVSTATETLTGVVREGELTRLEIVGSPSESE